MALTSDGMFYVGKGEAAELGKGITGLFGQQSEFEQQFDQVKAILNKTDMTDRASRQEALRQIAPISMGAYAEVADRFSKLDKADLDFQKAEAYARQVELQEQKIKADKTKKTKPEKTALGKEYDNTQSETDLRNWLINNAPAINPEDIGTGVLTKGKAQDLIFKAYKGKSGAKFKELKEYMKSQREAYIEGTDAVEAVATPEDAPVTTTTRDAALFAPRQDPAQLKQTTETVIPSPDEMKVVPIADDEWLAP